MQTQFYVVQENEELFVGISKAACQILQGCGYKML